MNQKDVGPVRILAVAPYEAMTASLKKSAEGFPDVRLDAYTGDLEEGVEILKSRDISLYDAILSRGGTADMIRQITDLPVVEIPVMIYDILRTIKLAENYTDRMAVVGFPGVTGNAHTLCNLLRIRMPIETVHSPEEIPEVLDRLRRRQIDTVICDAVSHRTARAAGFQALLITSGERSLTQAIDNAIQQGKLFRRMKSENTFLRTMLQQNMQQCVVFDAEKDVVYSFSEKLSDGTAAAMRRRISSIPENRELLFYHQEGTTLHSITASRFQLRDRQMYLFRDEPARISLRSAQPGIRFYDTRTRAAREHKVERHLGHLQTLCFALLLDFGEVGEGVHFLFDGFQSDEFIQFLIGVALHHLGDDDTVFGLIRFLCNLGDGF